MSLQSFKEKLEHFNGLYKLNLAIEEEREYFLESIGGEDNLKENFSTIYSAYQNSLDAVQKRMQNDAKANDLGVSVNFTEYDIHVKDKEPTNTDDDSREVYLKTSLNGSFMDKLVSVNDAEPARAFSVYLDGKVYDVNSPRLPYMEIHNFYEKVNQINDYPCSERAYTYAELNNRTLRFKFNITVCGETDGTNLMDPYVYIKDKTLGNLKFWPIKEIHVDSPVSKHPDTKQIRILYGRTEKNLDKADYIYSSNKPEDNGQKMWTVIPIKGYVKLDAIYSGDKYYSFKELLKPSEEEMLGRSTLQYANKDWKVFRPDLNDNDLYKLMSNFQNGIFKVEMGANNVETLYFDLCNPKWDADSDRRYDWVDDIDKASTDDRERICYLEGGFEYVINEVDIYGKEVIPGTSFQIHISSVDNLDEGRKYYVYEQGSNTIYIPPLRLWWGCYTGDTDILLADGNCKRADEVEIGDTLLCYGGKKLVVDNIYYGEKEEEIIHIKTDKGAEVKVSTGHPMLMENGTGRAAERLKAGDRIRMVDGTCTGVTSVTTEPFNDTVYNFTFEGEEEANYLIANKLYSGDFYAQNKAETEPPALSDTQKELNRELKALAIFLGEKAKQRQNFA